MTGLFDFLFQFADYVTFLLLAALGLIIILGIVDIINLAHGELIMMGAYVSTLAYHRGVPFWLTIPISVIALAVFGMILEPLVIRRFYRDKIGALVATWGLSLILSQGALIVFGASMPSVPQPQMTFRIGAFTYDGYRLLLFGVAIAVVIGLGLVLYRTTLGVRIRATMQNAEMARSIGTDTKRIYWITFSTGSALAGLTGALYAPTTSIDPTFGGTFIAPAFITVVVGGGANPIVGALGSSGLLSAVSTPIRIGFGTFLGLVVLLLTSLILIRFLPSGISGWITEFRRRRMSGRLKRDAAAEATET